MPILKAPARVEVYFAVRFFVSPGHLEKLHTSRGIQQALPRAVKIIDPDSASFEQLC